MNLDKKYYNDCQSLANGLLYFVCGLFLSVVLLLVFWNMWICCINIPTFIYLLICDYRIRYNLKKYA